MPLQATSGAASYDGFGGGVAAVPQYIEDVFSTYLYTGTGAAQTITNNIDLAGNGGLVWNKYRSGSNAAGHFLADNIRGISKTLRTNSEGGEQTTSYFTAFNSNGYSISSTTEINSSSNFYASWSFREQSKFFKIVTYTGNGTAGRQISHTLGSTPACVIVKSTSSSRRWAVYHRSNGGTPQNNFLNLNTTGASIASSAMWNNTTPTSTVFTLGSGTYEDPSTGELTSTNENGVTYVAYLFAHDAGGFGLSGTDNVISCGSYTGNGTAGNAVTLGFEPQFVITKQTSIAGGGWVIQDVMRGMSNTGSVALSAQTSNAEADYGVSTIIPTATGFTLPSYGGWNASGETFIYIAIRRGPMKVPTLGTSVFSPIASADSAGTQLTTNFPVDLQMYGIQAGDAANITTNDRLRGVSTTSTAGGNHIVTSSTAAETGGSYTRQWGNTGFVMPVALGDTQGVFWNFRRAPGFFDVLCYTGTATAQSISHNLGVVPELAINKNRDGTFGWYTQFNFTATTYDQNTLSTTNAANLGVTYGTGGNNFSAKPTASLLPLGATSITNLSAKTYVYYLFATCAGVSKVFSYTGNGSSQTINCGFTGGARFVLIKRTDSTGNWYVWDTARGIVSGDDPYLLLNSTAAEVTTNDTIDTDSTGFVVNQVTATSVNVSSATYIGLAIA